MRTQIKFIMTMLLCVVVVTAFAIRDRSMRSEIVYAQAVQEPVLTINDKNITLEDIAFYVAYEEKVVQEQALIYDPENPSAYWNIYEDNAFISVTAKQAVIDMAVHDMIFYELAEQEGIVLEEEEVVYYKNEAYDFCSDLEAEQFEDLGVSEDVIYESMRRIAIANKYQNIKCEVDGVDYADYNLEGEAYLAMKQEYEIIIHEDIWDRVGIGGVTLDNY